MTELHRSSIRMAPTTQPRPSSPGLVGRDRARAHFPTLIGAIVFLQGIGAAIPLSAYDWHVRVFVLPAVLVVSWLMLSSARPTSAIRIDLVVLSVTAWLVLSALWSTAPVDVTVEVALYVLAATFCTHLGTAAFDTSELLDSLVAMMAVALVLIVAYSLADPAGSFSVNDAAAPFGGSVGMRSFFAHKNSLGMLLAFGAALVPAVRSHAARAAYTFSLAALLALANSSTAIIAAVSAVIGQVFVSRAAAERRAGPRGGVFLVVSGAIIVAGSVIAGRDFILELLGKDPTLTGRSAIWSASLEAARARPITGYGLEGFWQGGHEAAYQVQRVASFDVTSSHQGVIDLWLTGGVVGVALYAIALGAVGVLIARRVLAGDGGATTLTAFGLIAVVIVVSLSESNLTAPGLPVVAMTSALLLNVRATDHRRRSPS